MARTVRDSDAPPRSRKAMWIWLGIAAVLVVLLVVALEVTGQPWFCGTCHEMKPAYQGWVDSDHLESSDADCMDCHADPGIIGYFKAHVVDGLRDVYIHFIAGPPEQVEDSYVPEARCLRCHQDEFDDEEFADDHPADEDEYCAECHRDEVHANDRPE